MVLALSCKGLETPVSPIIKFEIQKHGVAAPSWQHRTLDFSLYQQEILVVLAMVAGVGYSSCSWLSA